MSGLKNSRSAKQQTTDSKYLSPAPAGPAPGPQLSAVQRAVVDLGAASPADILALQQTHGNRATQRLLARRAVQAKLTVGPADDKYEQEADRVADRVMSASAPSSPSPQLQRDDDDEDVAQRKPLAAAITPLIQRHSIPSKKSPEEKKEDEEEEKKVQRKPDSQARADGGFEAGGGFEQRLAASPGGRGLSPALRSEMESRFGADFGSVKVHTDSAAVQMSRDISAQAFTHGKHIYFGPGKYDPGTANGKHLLAHELTHVVQQTGAARVQRASDFNVKMGEKLPDVKQMAAKRMKSVLGYDDPKILAQAQSHFVPDAQTNIADDSFMTPIAQTALDRFKKTDSAASVAQDIRDSFNKFVDPKLSLADIVSKIKDDLKATKKDALLGVRIMAANDFKTKTEEYTMKEAAAATPGLRKERKYLKPGRDVAGATEAFWKSRQKAVWEESVPKEEFPGFAAALKQMPIVQYLLTPRKERSSKAATGGWKDGGKLEDKIKPVNDLVWIKKWLGSWRTNSKTFRKRLNKVDQMVRATVEPELLSEIPKPNINVHATSSWFFRANAGGGDVHLAYDEATNVVAHEVGHILEEYLPMKRWHDIHLMLGARHKAAGGGETAVIGDQGNKKEGRYAGAYVTGDYTSTAYKGDNAEVVSMAMQFLTKPKDALKLIEGDPQHAAIVLRGFKPTEYKDTASLRKYDKYLPNKQKTAKPKAKTKEQEEADGAFERVKAILEQYQGFEFEVILTLGEVNGFDVMKALSVQGEERGKRIQAFIDANSGVTKEALRYYVD